MLAHGAGAVINVGSINGTTGMSGAALYGASKAALHSMTKSWAAEWGRQGVRVNTVAPGPTEAEWNEVCTRAREVSQGQELIEVMELRGLAAARRGLPRERRHSHVLGDHRRRRRNGRRYACRGNSGQRNRVARRILGMHTGYSHVDLGGSRASWRNRATAQLSAIVNLSAISTTRDDRRPHRPCRHGCREGGQPT
jgi:NAD(P)-dependent dehydrogenase (short-subunit alcohol dehydrogenase family)